MKVIEGMKKIKDLQKKIDDTVHRIAEHSADLEHQEPVYGTYGQQKKQVAAWVQSVRDMTKEILRLRLAVQKTNLQTRVSIVVSENKEVEHSVAEWIHRRRDLAAAEARAWRALTDRNLKIQTVSPTGKVEDAFIAKIRRYFDPKERDDRVDALSIEPSVIDAKLEVVNAITDLIED